MDEKSNNTEDDFGKAKCFKAQVLLDRRSSERLPPNVEPTYVWVSLDKRIKTRMMDQSEGGLGLIAPKRANYEIGFQIRVEMEPGIYRMGEIINIIEHDEENYRMGIAWEDDAYSRSSE